MYRYDEDFLYDLKFKESCKCSSYHNWLLRQLVALVAHERRDIKQRVSEADLEIF